MTTVIEYVQHAGGWFASVSTQNSREQVHFQVAEALLTKISEWIEQIERANPVAFAEWITSDRLQQLYRGFIAPLEAYLPPPSQGERLILAPDGPLSQFPLNAALNPTTTRYLAEEYSLTFVSDSSALQVYLNKARQLEWQWHPPQEPLHIACSGHPHLEEELCLQSIEESAFSMKQILPNTKLLTEQNATVQAVRFHLPSRDLVHFFCHGIFKLDDLYQSGLLLYDRFLPAGEIAYEFDFSQTHLIVLAACRSNKIYMMVENLFIARTKIVVTALWNVNELATQQLFQHFYMAIGTGLSSAKALEQAVQMLRQGKTWQHPYYWAAFQNIGLAYGVPILN